MYIPHFRAWIKDVFLVVKLFCKNLLCINPNYIIFLCILNVYNGLIFEVS